MIILGLDLSLTRTGYAVLDGKKLKTYGHITPPKDSKSDILRIDAILRQINGVVKDNNVEKLMVEDIFFGLNTKGFKKLAKLGGVVAYYWYRKTGKEATFLMATSARKKVGLSGRASKCEVQLYICGKYKFMDNDQLKYFGDKMNNVQTERKESGLSKSKADSLLIKLSKQIEEDCGISTDMADAILIAEAGKMMI